MLLGIACCLIQVWAPACFLTGDGPCHVENAQILHDFWVNHNTALYARFYEVVYQPNPNWFSTFVMALFLFIVNGIIAEKLFLTCYIALYVSGFYRLLKRVSGNKSYWLLVIFSFVFTHALTKGFYNFSFGIAFYFWVVWSWLRYLEKKRLVNVLLFFLFTFLIFFAHLLAFVFAILTCVALILSYSTAADSERNKQDRKKFFIKNLLTLTLFISPFLAITAWFTTKEGGMHLYFKPHFYRLVELAQFKHIVNFSHNELAWTTITGCALLLLFMVCFTKLKGLLKVNKYDGFLWTFLFVGFIYLCFPDSILGRQMDMSLRTQLFVHILVAIVIAYRMRHEKLMMAGALVLFVCFIALSGLRFINQLSASGAEGELLAAGSVIKPNSVVLPLNFSPGGINKQGKVIADWNASFRHATQYLGTGKPLIILDNYEANAGYFPIQWKSSVNPYLFLAAGNGIEGIPPFARIALYKQQTGISIDYIIISGYNSSFLTDPDFKALYTEINAMYHIACAVPGGRVIVYEKNSRQP
jgi:hypothetical protein